MFSLAEEKTKEDFVRGGKDKIVAKLLQSQCLAGNQSYTLPGHLGALCRWQKSILHDYVNFRIFTPQKWKKKKCCIRDGKTMYLSLGASWKRLGGAAEDGGCVQKRWPLLLLPPLPPCKSHHVRPYHDVCRLVHHHLFPSTRQKSLKSDVAIFLH